MLKNAFLVFIFVASCFAEQQNDSNMTTGLQETSQKNPEKMNGFEKIKDSVGGIGKDAKDVYKNIVQGDEKKQ
jgi:hypothetical protein